MNQTALYIAMNSEGDAFSPSVAAAALIEVAGSAGRIGRKTVLEGREFLASVCAIVNLSEMDKSDRTKAHRILCDACTDLNEAFTVQSSTKGAVGSKVTTWSVVDRVTKSPEQKKSEADAAATAAATAAAAKLEGAVSVATAAALAPVQSALELALAERDMLADTLKKSEHARGVLAVELQIMTESRDNARKDLERESLILSRVTAELQDLRARIAKKRAPRAKLAKAGEPALPYPARACGQGRRSVCTSAHTASTLPHGPTP